MPNKLLDTSTTLLIIQMSTPIPIYTTPCMVSTRVPSTFYLAGVSERSSGLFEVHAVDLPNISSPKVTILGFNQNPDWGSSAPKYCSPFLGDQGANSNSPFHLQQLSRDFPGDTHVFPSGMIEPPGGLRVCRLPLQRITRLLGLEAGIALCWRFQLYRRGLNGWVCVW